MLSFEEKLTVWAAFPSAAPSGMGGWGGAHAGSSSPFRTFQNKFGNLGVEVIFLTGFGQFTGFGPLQQTALERAA